jgi:hypothetical protein
LRELQSVTAENFLGNFRPNSLIGRREVDFLFANRVENEAIVLREGVQNCFRRFYGIVEGWRREWFEMVRKLNPTSIGAPLDLAEFMFGSERNQWPGIRPLLREIQGGKCFYCELPITGNEHLDHFIRWSIYPNDLAR